MSETNQNLGTLTWLDEGGFYWLDGELTNQLQLYPVKKMRSGDGITDHSGAPETLVFGDVTFTKVDPDDNVYKTNVVGDDGEYSLVDIDDTGYYTGFTGRQLRARALTFIFKNNVAGDEVSFSLSVRSDYAIITLDIYPSDSQIRIAYTYADSTDYGSTTSGSVTTSQPSGADFEGCTGALSISTMLGAIGIWSNQYYGGKLHVKTMPARDPDANSYSATVQLTYDPLTFYYERLASAATQGL